MTTRTRKPKTLLEQAAEARRRAAELEQQTVAEAQRRAAQAAGLRAEAAALELQHQREKRAEGIRQQAAALQAQAANLAEVRDQAEDEWRGAVERHELAQERLEDARRREQRAQAALAAAVAGSEAVDTIIAAQTALQAIQSALEPLRAQEQAAVAENNRLHAEYQQLAGQVVDIERRAQDLLSQAESVVESWSPPPPTIGERYEAVHRELEAAGFVHLPGGNPATRTGGNQGTAGAWYRAPDGQLVEGREAARCVGPALLERLEQVAAQESLGAGPQPAPKIDTFTVPRLQQGALMPR